MNHFEVPFQYLTQNYVALVSRDRPMPDIISIQEPNNLMLPSLFMIDSQKINGLPVFSEYPGLAIKIAVAIIFYCRLNLVKCN